MTAAEIVGEAEISQELRSVDQRPGAFFRQLAGSLPVGTVPEIIAVAHMVPNSLHFLPALGNLGSLKLVLMKPHSISPDVRSAIEVQFPTLLLDRDWSADPGRVIETLQNHLSSQSKFLLVDIGGYFAAALPAIATEFAGRFMGVLEGTANGLAKYRDNSSFESAPVISVADSPLKYPENHLIGASVVYSIEAILRDNGQVLQAFQACVLGFGRVGRSVAAALRGRGISTSVFDQGAIPLAEAAAQGYPVSRALSDALRDATIVVCATGNRSLKGGDFALLCEGAYVATVTSGDDELEMAALEHGFVVKDIPPHLTRYSSANKHFYLVNGGQAVNFVHSAVVGPAIQLIEGEKLAAVAKLTEEALKPGLHEVRNAMRQTVAGAWLDHFLR
jgi:adenosylhomocysteinase